MDYYKEIKNELVNNEVYKRVKDYSKNRHELESYYKVGKLLVDAQGGKNRAKYGDGLIKEYAKRLTNELGKGYTVSDLKRMRQFYIIIEKGATLSHQLTWSHYVELLSIKNVYEINYYINYIDKNVKKINHDKTVGIIIVRKDNKFIMEYCSNPSIFKTTYELV